ncbi:tetratricopeptide repeat protein [Caulobacter sp. 17J65-9]|uniref:tetratricopeptide repeat protein n=1 Tax=Caulobacter sp. 17J65-9 TaxID=2709382 RepID=UPI0013C5C70C|nr:tetratricopeptide repeat protein [Caulobacter sp. 17J65-9]NEX93810.1 sel1 repeat family protein [Caulobacter sp. 17J65-9]
MFAPGRKPKVEWDVDALEDPLLAEYERARDQLHGADWREALKELESLADRGSLMSMLLVADAAREGWKYEQDLPDAEAWYEAAVEAGSARGLFGLGRTHLAMGRFAEAIHELEAAIARGFPAAYNVLAIMYFNGEGVPVDRWRAWKLWRKGAALGHLPAKRHMVHQALHGRFGLWGRVVAIVNLLPVAIETGIVQTFTPYTDRRR